MTEQFDNIKSKVTDVQGQIENFKNMDAQVELEKLKNKALDVDSHIDMVKAKGNVLRDKIIELGIGGGAVLLLGILAQWLFPWWSIAIVAFYVGFWVHDSAVRSFAYGTAAVILLWSVYAGWQSSANGGLMSGTLSDMFNGALSATQLILATGLIGGLVGGSAAMAGTLFRNLFKKDGEIATA